MRANCSLRIPPPPPHTSQHLKCPCCSGRERAPRARGRFQRANNHENREPANRDGGVEFVSANQARNPQVVVNRQPAAARDYGRLAIDRAASTGALPPAPAEQPKPAGPTLEMKMTMVKQIKEIIPDTSNEKALSALQVNHVSDFLSCRHLNSIAPFRPISGTSRTLSNFSWKNL